MTKQKGFLGGSYKLSTVNFDCADTINFYPEMDEIQTGKDQEVLMLRSRPGLTLLHNIPRPPIRAIHQTQNGYIYVVAGNGVFNLTTTDGINWTHHLIATLTTQTGHAYIQDGVPNVVNGQLNTARIVQVVVVDGSTTGVAFTEGQTSVTLLGPGNGYQGSNFVTFQDGFFLFSQPNTPVIQFAADPMNIVGTDTIVQNATADDVVRVICDHDIVWTFNAKSCLIYQNTGGVGFFTPNNLFQNIPGSVSEGGAFPHTICQLGGQLLWLQTDKNGCGQVFEAIGYRGARISTHSQELIINNSGDLNLATAWTYQVEGHSFYCLNIPGASTTLCYDLITKMWTERCFFQQGIFSRDLVEYHYNINLPGIGQIPMVGDFQNGNLYRLDDTNYTDNGQPIYRQRTTSHLASAYHRMTVSKLQVDCETGVGLDGLGYPYQNGTTGNPVVNTASTVEMIGNGPSYQFAGNDGSIVTPLSSPVPTITASGIYSNSYRIVGNTLTVLPGIFSIGPVQIGIGNGETSTYNLSSNYGTNVSNVALYANDWRGDILQLHTPRTNLVSYASGGVGGGGFATGWSNTGVNTLAATNAGATNTTSSVQTVNQPTANAPTVTAADVTIQDGWSQMIYNSAARPALGVASDKNGTYSTSGTGLNSGTSLSLVTSGSNYVAGTNTGYINGIALGPIQPGPPMAPRVSYPSSYVFSSFGSGTKVTGTLYISISTTTSIPYALGGFNSPVGEVDISYKADQMTAFQLIAAGIGGNDMVGTIPVDVQLTIQNLSTLQVQITQTSSWFGRDCQMGSDASSGIFTDSFKIYDIAFLMANQFNLNAPDGSATGVALCEDGTMGPHGVSTTYNSVQGQNVCMSVYGLLGDANRYLQLQIGSSPTISASSIFSLGNPLTSTAPSVISTAYGNAAISQFASAIPSTGTILVNTLIVQNQSGLIAQIAPSVLAIPTNGATITFAWSFVSGTGATITSGATTSQISFNVTTANNLSLQCIITANGVQTIYTQFINVVASSSIVRMSVSGVEVVQTGPNLVSINLVNPTNNLTYAEPTVNYIPTALTGQVTTITTCAPGAKLAALMPVMEQSGSSYSWTISGTGSPAITSATTNPTVVFTAGSLGSGGANGYVTVTCVANPGGSGNPIISSSATIQIIPTMQTFYQGILNSGWVGIWGCQVEETTLTPTSFIATIGQPLTDLYTLNSQTGTILFGVAPIEESVLTASFTITEISPGPVEFYWSGQYMEAAPNYTYLGTNPQLALSYSKDEGHTWSAPQFTSLGSIGNYLNRVIWRRLGQGRDWVWRISCSDPIKLTLTGHDLDAKVSMN